MSKESVDVAVIGLGKMGWLHASILNVMTNVHIAAVCDKSALIRKLAKKLFKNVRVVDDLEQLRGMDLDSVYVTTPIPTHFRVVESLCSMGISNKIFVEKTLAADLKQAQHLCELVHKPEDVNMVGYMKRYAVTFRKAKSTLDQGILGKVNSFEAYAYSSDFSGMQKGSKIPASRGGVLQDLGAHVIDLALWFFGDFEVNSTTHDSKVEGNCEDWVRFTVARPNVEGHFNVSWCMEGYRLPDFGLTISCDEGVLRVTDDLVELKLNGGNRSVWYRHDLNDSVDFLLGNPEYYREDAAFVKSVLTASKAEPSFLEASKVDHIIDQVKEDAGKR